MSLRVRGLLTSTPRLLRTKQTTFTRATFTIHLQKATLFTPTIMTPLPKQTKTSGESDAVWVKENPYVDRPEFKPLKENLETDVCIVGAGIAGVSSAYELVKRGQSVVLIEAREVISGESGRTSGHLSYALDDNFASIASKHGKDGAMAAATSHHWAAKHVGQVARELNIDCEYREVTNYEISQWEHGTPDWNLDMADIKQDVDWCKDFGLPVSYDEKLSIKGWDGKIDQRGGGIYREHAAFHPTKYISGLLRWLSESDKFRCYTHTRMTEITESTVIPAITGSKKVTVTTDRGYDIKCDNAIEATCIPLQKLSVVAYVEYYRSLCIAIRVPKGSVEDCLFNDQADPYHYVRLTPADSKDDYLIVGGEDYKVAQASDQEERYARLENWTRDRFPQATTVDYRWSGQILDSTDSINLIGLNPGRKHTYIVTGDTGHGLTQGVIASRILADAITGIINNPWASLYNPKRLPPIKALPDMLAHDAEVNLQYKKWGSTEIEDIEDLKPGCGGVLNKPLQKSMAVYKDEDGTVYKYSAKCPHLGGRLCWNNVEKSFDCPIHGSRFSKEGICVMGPAKMDLTPFDEESKEARGTVE